MGFSRSESCYASTAKLLNFLIACLLMTTLAFSAIPHFVVKHSKGEIVAKRTKASMNRAKIVAAQRVVNPNIIRAAQPYVYRTSNRGSVKVQGVSGRNHALSPINFEARKIEDERMPTP